MAKHDLDDLIGTAEIGELAGVSSAAVTVWRGRHEAFPAPLVRVRSGPLYSRRAVVAWLEETGRLKSNAPRNPRIFT